MKVIIDEPFEGSEIWTDYQQKNLRSALAIAALTTESGQTEQNLYETIVEIPQYENTWL